MKYDRIIKGRFLDRPNRFVAHVDIGGETLPCHVKNTGRCRELLLPGVPVYLQESDNPSRKTRYDLMRVEKGDMLINMDSQITTMLWQNGCKRSSISKGRPHPDGKKLREFPV